jgi:peptidyl-prolyl cis-trans isomerase C
MTSSKLKWIHGSVVSLLLIYTQSVWSADAGGAVKDAEVVLIKNSLATVTKADYYTELRRLPQGYSGSVEIDSSRILKIIDNILQTKSLAAEARMLNIDSEPEIQQMFDWMKERGLAQLRMQRLDADAEAAFKAKEAAYESRAKEMYKVNSAKYTEPATVTASHVLVNLDHRSKEEALKRAEEVHKLALEGKPFEDLVTQYSDDPSSKQNNGNLGAFGSGAMVKPFEEAAFALEKPGDISAPVETKFGFHIIRLGSKNPGRVKTYEEVRTSIMANLKAEFVSGVRAEYTKKIGDDKATVINEAAVASLKKNVDLKEPVPTKPEAAQR